MREEGIVITSGGHPGNNLIEIPVEKVASFAGSAVSISGAQGGAVLVCYTDSSNKCVSCGACCALISS